MSIKGLCFIVWMYFKRLIREILKAIWRFLTKKRYMGNHPKTKKAIMLTFLSINAIAWIVAPSYLLVSIPNEKIIIEAKAQGVGTMVETEETETAVQDTISGMEEQQASLEVAPSAVEDKICAVFGEDCEIMIAIAKAESGLNPYAYHKNNNGSEDFGIFQINSIHGEDNLFDVDKNIEVAKKIYDTQGLNAWYAYQNNKHLQFL